MSPEPAAGPAGPSHPAGPTGPEELTCSAKGCQAPATWELLWNNPKLHTPDRRKTWLACDEHRDSLSDFLGARGFLKERRPIAS